jgi:uncharacterized membrane protein
MKPDPSTPKRSIAKAVCWETVSNLVCFLLAWATFGDFGGCAVFSIICFGVKLVMFYYHERLWHQIPFGRQP